MHLQALMQEPPPHRTPERILETSSAVRTHAIKPAASQTSTRAPYSLTYSPPQQEALVHRCRLRRRPRDVWRALAAAAANVTNRSPISFAFEMAFHVIMGEAAWVRPWVAAHYHLLNVVGNYNCLHRWGGRTSSPRCGVHTAGWVHTR